MPPIALGDPVRSSTLGRVVESRHPDFQVGDIVVGLAANGWEDFSLTAGEQLDRIQPDPRFPLSHYLSVFSAVGLLDLAYANVATFLHQVDPASLGASYYLVVLNVPAMIVVHVCMIVLLLERPAAA